MLWETCCRVKIERKQKEPNYYYVITPTLCLWSQNDKWLTRELHLLWDSTQLHSQVSADLYTLVWGSGVVSQTLLLMKHGPHQSSLASGSRLVGTKNVYIHKVSLACFMTLTLTDHSGFLWLLLTLWEGWGRLTWSQRTWGPPRFGKCGKEASSEPAVEKGGTQVVVTTATCKVTSLYGFSTKPFSWPGWQIQVCKT